MRSRILLLAAAALWGSACLAQTAHADWHQTDWHHRGGGDHDGPRAERWHRPPPPRPYGYGYGYGYRPYYAPPPPPPFYLGAPPVIVGPPPAFYYGY